MLAFGCSMTKKAKMPPWRFNLPFAKEAAFCFAKFEADVFVRLSAHDAVSNV